MATPASLRAQLDEVKDHSPHDFQITRRSDDAFITRFINVAKGDADKAVSRLVSLEKWEVKYIVEECEHLTAITQRRFFEMNMFCFASANGEPLVSREGLPVMLMNFSNCNYDLVPPPEAPVGMYYCLEKWLRGFPQLHEQGSFWVAETNSVGWSQFNLHVEKVTSELISNVIPIRLSGMYLMREPFMFKMMFALVRPFLSAKLLSRIHVCGMNFEQLHEDVAPEQLPELLGGSATIEATSSLAHRYLMEEVERFTVTISAESGDAAWAPDAHFAEAILCTTGAGPFYKDDVLLEVEGTPVTRGTVPDLPNGTSVVVGRIMQDILGRPVKHEY